MDKLLFDRVRDRAETRAEHDGDVDGPGDTTLLQEVDGLLALHHGVDRVATR